MEQQTSFEKAHAMVEHIFRALLPEHGLMIREAQIMLCHEMLDTLFEGKIALCDAGVGIGKTHAYLTACLLWQRFCPVHLPGTVVISTSSIALQGAIMNEYIPFLSRVFLQEGILERPICAVVRKGKERFVCINRLEFGKKYCKLSPSISEDVLHNAILRAIKELFQQQKEQTQKCLHDTILQCAAGGLDTSLTTLKNQLEQKNRDFDRILEMTLTDGMESEFMEAKMSRLNDEILQIKQMIKRQEHETKMQQAKGDKTRDLLAIITDRDFQIAEYSDMLVTRIIEQITVLSAEKIRIRFVDGYTKEQRL